MAILKAIGPPGSLGFLVALVAVGLFVGYVWPRWRRLGHAWLVATFSGYLLLSWPPTAGAIVAALGAPSPTRPVVSRPLDALIVFDGDNRLARARTADEAFAIAAPVTVHVVGSPWIIDMLGPAVFVRMTHHPATATTLEQMTWVRRFVDGPGAGARAAIVTSRLQAPRVVALAARADVRLPVIASALDVEPATQGMWRLVPSLAALHVSRDGLYELAALYYYRWHGWI